MKKLKWSTIKKNWKKIVIAGLGVIIGGSVITVITESVLTANISKRINSNNGLHPYNPGDFNPVLNKITDGELYTDYNGSQTLFVYYPVSERVVPADFTLMKIDGKDKTSVNGGNNFDNVIYSEAPNSNMVMMKMDIQQGVSLLGGDIYLETGGRTPEKPLHIVSAVKNSLIDYVKKPWTITTTANGNDSLFLQFDNDESLNTTNFGTFNPNNYEIHFEGTDATNNNVVFKTARGVNKSTITGGNDWELEFDFSGTMPDTIHPWAKVHNKDTDEDEQQGFGIYVKDLRTQKEVVLTMPATNPDPNKPNNNK